MREPKNPQRMALVLSGGGVRGAYEAGVINYIRTQIHERHGGRKTFEVQCGSSVGAINTCFMASMAHQPFEQGQRLRFLWDHVDQDKIYKRHFGALGSLLSRTAKGISINLFNLHKKDQEKKGAAHFKGFFDTSPLPQYLHSIISFKDIGHNLKKGILAAVSVRATNVSTGRMELFIQKRPNVIYSGEYTHYDTRLSVVHVMASGAIPLIFPAVKVKHNYYIDGSLRLNTPMSPAIQLGAGKIMIIGLHHIYQPGEQYHHILVPNQEPSLGQIVGKVMNSFFLDRLQYDVEQLRRINRIIEWSEKVYGKDYLEKINHRLKEQGIKGDIANRGLKKMKVFQIFPSRDVSELFSECYEDTRKKEYFTTFEKMLFRLFDVDPGAGVDTLSYLAFMPNYIHQLLELGFHDAEAHREEIIEFLLS